jgi:hypothetical protein
MSRGSQKKVRPQPVARVIPAWARDNLVLKLLDDKGMRLEVMYDQKYLNGIENQPLIVIRRKR